MWRFNGHGLRFMYLSIVIGIMIVILLVSIIWQDMAENGLTGVRYDSAVYQTNEPGPFCPGDVLTHNVTSFRDRVAPVDVIGNWCRIDNALCLADETLDYHIAIFDLREPVTRTRLITIPDNPRIFPGEWVYVHQIAVANTDHWQTYLVPFTVATGCGN